MADNVPITSGSGILIGAENITVSGSATLIQRVKLVIGTYDIDGGDVSSVNPIPVSGSTTILGTVTVTGSTSVTSIPAITGSVSLVLAPSFGSATVNVTGATSNFIVIPSTATNSVYLTSLLISNGLTGGTISFGNTNTTTAGNIVIQPLYFAANGGCAYPIPQQTPIKLSAGTNFVATTATAGTLSIVATYYVAA